MPLIDAWHRQLAREREHLADAEKKRAAALKKISQLEKKIARGR